jgi:hypothetical protein
MRNLGILLGLFLWPVLIHAADLRPVIKREAGKCAAAWEQNNYEAVLAFLPPQVIKRSGGRAAALKRIKSQYALAGEYGVERIHFTSGQPTAPKVIGPWHTALVPLTAVLHRSPVDVTQATHLLALSADKGKRWYFVPLYNTTRQQLNAWFPELAGKLVIPVDPEPEFGLAL